MQPVVDTAAQAEHAHSQTRATRRARRGGGATSARSRAAVAASRARAGSRPGAARAGPAAQEHRLVHALAAPAEDERAHVDVEAAAPRRLLDRRPSPPLRCRCCGASTLRSSASRRSLPHHQPATSEHAREPGRGRTTATTPTSRRASDHGGRPHARGRARAPPPTERAGGQIRARGSRDDEPLQLRDAAGADAGHGVELVDRVESPVRLAELDDLLRGRRADAGQGVELLDRRRVQVDGRGRRRRRAARRRRRPRRGAARRPAARRRAAPRD